MQLVMHFATPPRNHIITVAENSFNRFDGARFTMILVRLLAARKNLVRDGQEAQSLTLWGLAFTEAIDAVLFPYCKVSATTCSKIHTVEWLWLTIYLCVVLLASASSQHPAGMATLVLLLFLYCNDARLLNVFVVLYRKYNKKLLLS